MINDELDNVYMYSDGESELESEIESEIESDYSIYIYDEVEHSDMNVFISLFIVLSFIAILVLLAFIALEIVSQFERVFASLHVH